MRIKLAGAVGVLLFASTVAHAQLSSTITLTSDYDFRGFSQSAKDPALQASLDYDLENGFAVGAWASNIDFEPLDGDIEIDFYGSYTGEIDDDTSWTAGAVWYSYPGSDDIQEYAEIYGGLDKGPVGAKLWYSPDLYDIGESAWYLEGNGTIELPQDFSLLLHAGYSFGDAWDDFDAGGLGGELFDYSIGLGYALEQFSLALKWTGTDASGDQEIRDDVGNNEGRLVFSIATTLPWEKE
jgi:uncharacterized protein (TIGR02001 family)